MTQKPGDARGQGRTWFVSWRWRIVLPLFLAVALAAMAGAYTVASGFGRSFGVSQDNILLESVRGMSDRTTALYRRQYQEAQRVAFTIGVPEAVQLGQAAVLEENLEAFARAAELDSLILTDVTGVEVLGVQRVLLSGLDDYAVNTGTNLAEQDIVRDALGGGDGAAALFRTPEGTVLFVSASLMADGEIVGAVLAGKHLAAVAEELAGTAVASVAVYGGDGELAETTLDLDDATRADLRLPPTLIDETLAGGAEVVPLRSITVGETPTRAAYTPLAYGDSVLGVVAVLLPDSLPFATEMGRQLIGLMAATLAGVAVAAAFVGVGFFTGRVERVGETAAALARGESSARTRMQPTDEAGATGAALDAYANRVQQEQEVLQGALRRGRREVNHLTAVLQSMPDGVVVQDNTGVVTFINDTARELLGGARDATLDAVAAEVNATLGAEIAPGVYTLGDPQQISVENRMLNAQAAAVVTVNDERVGTVVVLRDISEFVRREQERARLLRQVEEAVTPLDELAQTGAFGAPPVNAFAREITRRAVALHKLVVEIRELTAPEVRGAAQQNPVQLDALVWGVANEWRQIAAAAGLSMDVSVAQTGLHVLGDEKRLRWAIGNLLDNAIKYTPPGGGVTLEMTGQRGGQATLRVRDSGVGITADELAKVTMRFYRGNPHTSDGEIIRTPGMGQGLYTAKTIFEAHGGFLRVRSKPGVGTAVDFSLPVTAPEAMDLPLIKADYEGETVRLPENSRLGRDR